MQATFVKLENVDLRQNVLVQFSSDVEVRNVASDFADAEFADNDPMAGADTAVHPVVLISTKGNPKTLFDFAFAAGKDVSLDAEFKYGNRNMYGNSWHSDEDGRSKMDSKNDFSDEIFDDAAARRRRLGRDPSTGRLVYHPNREKYAR